MKEKDKIKEIRPNTLDGQDALNFYLPEKNNDIVFEEID